MSADEKNLEPHALFPAADWLAAGPRHWHLVGACGIGMAALAILLRERGDRVSGCDLDLNPLADLLRARGVELSAGHDPAHLASAPEALVISTAVPRETPELTAARAAGIPVFGRGAVLAALTASRPLVAVCGSHGKSTTTAFTAQVLRAAGVPAGWYVGAECAPLGAPACWGEARAPIVIEADESDGSLAGYTPSWLVITNVEFDHAEHFADLEALQACYRAAASRTREGVIAGADDAEAHALAQAQPRRLEFGLNGGLLRAVDVELGSDGSRFALLWEGQRVARVELQAPGRHNVLNALGAAAATRVLGLEWEAIARALALCRLPARRFERVVETPGARVVSDYAHHPGEIAALVRTARAQQPRTLRGVFQPHRYSRTRALAAQFPASMADVDDLVLVPVYAASEPPLEGGRIWDLYRAFRAPEAPPRAQPPRLAPSLETAWGYLRRALTPGDLLLIIGAGNVERLAAWARASASTEGLVSADPWLAGAVALGARTGVDLGRLTTLGVGGCADAFVEVEDEVHLAELLRFAHRRRLAWRILGAGSNVLVGDCGVRGLVARLAGEPFGRVERRGTSVQVGAGVPLARLLAFCEAEGLTGLEFLEGIPGLVGGALRMNAGAQGGEIAAHIVSIRGLNPDGSGCIVRRQELGAGYRRCEALQRVTAVEAVLELQSGASATIAARRAELAAGREWMRGLRSAGSVFRNPPAGPAGRLLEEAGLKGAVIGGARVTERHANVIATGPGATASDVWALLQHLRATVAAKRGVELEPEVEVW